MIRSKLLYFFIATALIAFSFVGCKKTLETSSPMVLNQDLVLSTELGFTEALNAVYLQMGSSSLYGRELTMGLLSVLGRSYDTTMLPQVGNLYYQGARYNFQDPAVFGAMKAVWDSSYQCIAGLNNIIDQADQRRDVFASNTNYNNLKAEAMALRAYLHFDLLRMFGPANVSQNLSATAIPYMKKLSPYAVPYQTVGGVLDSCVADLMLAKSMMSDSLKVTGHLNYWGIKALLARIYMYKGDLINAQSTALQLINSRKYLLVTTNTDILFSNEHIFSIYVFQNNLFNYLKSLFNTSTPLGLLPVNQTALYVTGSGSTAEWRKSLAFYDPATNTASNPTNPNALILPKKLSTVNGAIGGNNNNMMPMIRLSEIYYIAAECAQLNNNDLAGATTLLDTLRVHRNLPVYTLPALTTDSLTVEIRKEYMKELLGEGQVFYYFKRKNLNIQTLPFTKVPVIANATYTFPKVE